VVVTLCFTFLLPHDFSPAVLYAPVPVLILAATLFRPIGVSSAISLLALVSIISAAHGKGSFFTNDPQHGVLSMQLFLIANAAPLLFVAILLEERKAVERELRHSESVLKDKHNQIHSLAGRLLSAQEDERGRIARELHDNVSQRVALLSIGLEKLSGGFSPETGAERTLACSLLCDAQDLATDLHDLSHQLHSHNLELRGLESALRNLCRLVSKQQQIIVEFHSIDVSGLPADMNLCLFRVAQEAIANSIRHGKAQHIDILLQKQNGHFCLAVRDDGKGFDLASPSDGLGLVSMQERLRFVGGRLEVKSRPGAGTEVDAILPLITGGAS
jgi:signal transduction histidine kinase